jgi:hypothetical protein
VGLWTIEEDFAIEPGGKIIFSGAGIPLLAASAEVLADGRLIGYSRHRSSSGQRAAWPGSTRRSSTITIPHLAGTAGWRTGIGLFNPNEVGIEVNIAMDEGVPLDLNLEPKASEFVWLDGAQGKGVISASGPITAMEMFESLAPGGDLAAVLLSNTSCVSPSVPALSRGPGEFTGVGLVNATGWDSSLGLLEYQADGVCEKAFLGELPQQGWTAVDLSEICATETVWAEFRGESVLITPMGRPRIYYQAVAAYGEEQTGRLGAVQLGDLRFTDGFLGVVAADPEPTFSLVNPGVEDATLLVSALSADGEVVAEGTVAIEAGGNLTGLVSELVGGGSLVEVTHMRLVSTVELHGFQTIYTNDRMEISPVLAVE